MQSFSFNSTLQQSNNCKQVCFHSEEKETAMERSSQIEHQISMNTQPEHNICACNIKDVQCILLLVYHLQVWKCTLCKGMNKTDFSLNIKKISTNILETNCALPKTNFFLTTNNFNNNNNKTQNITYYGPQNCIAEQSLQT